MRLFSRILISALLLMPLRCVAQGFLASPCGAIGTSFTADFGGYGQLCWSGGPATCNVTWQVSGSPTIVANPAPLATPGACNQSLLINQSAAVQYVSIPLPQQIAQGQAADVYFTLDIVTNPGNGDNIVSLAQQGNGNGEIQAALQYNSATAVNVQGTGYSGGISAPIGTLLNVHIHLAVGTNSSSFQINGGTAVNFTEGAYPATYLVLGSSASETAKFYLNNLIINAAGLPSCAANTYPWLYSNWSQISTAPTAANLASSAVGATGGVWSTSASVSQLSAYTGITWPAFHGKQDVCGSWEAGGGSNGMQYATGTSTQEVTFTPTQINSASASLGYFWAANIPSTDTSYYDQGEIQGVSSTDFVDAQYRNGYIWEEAGNNTAGIQVCAVTTAATPAHVYWITLQYNTNGAQYVNVYDPENGWALCGSNSVAAKGGVAPLKFIVGNSGSEPQTSGYDWWYGPVLMDWTQGKFPAGW